MLATLIGSHLTKEPTGSPVLTKWWNRELMLATNFGSLCPNVTNIGSQNFGYQIWFCTILYMGRGTGIISRKHIDGLVQEQGKSEGFESCDRPIVRKRPIWVKIGDVLSRVTLKFDGWPWKIIGHLSFAVSSFVQHFIAISEFKIELQSGNARFGSIFRTVWPWNLTDDLEKQ